MPEERERPAGLDFSSSPWRSLTRGLTSLTKTQYDGLRWSDTLLLSWETSSALRLLGHGRRILLGERPVDDELDALFAVLALGVEKLLKVSLGHAHLRAREGWPRYFGKAKGHDIVRMHRELLKKVDRAPLTPALCAEVTAQLRRLREDRTLAALLSALGSFAAGGRYRWLDFLEGVDGREGALEGWIETVLVADGLAPFPSELEPDEWLRHANAVVEQSIAGWLDALRVFAASGALGRRGQSLARQIAEDDPHA